MKWFESTVAWLFPTILVDGTPWKNMWEEKDKESFLFAAKFFYPLAALVYVLHYFFYDVPNNLEPLENWLFFRLLMASIAMVCFAFYISPLTKYSWHKLPAILACWAFCQSQAYVALWHGLESWVFCFILIAITVVPLRLTALMSSIFVLVTVSTQAPLLREANIPVTYIYTGTLVALLFVLVVRSSYLAEVRTFLVDQENIAAQKKIIELNLEFSERIRSFIPSVIAERMEDFVEKARMTVLEASIEVLAPRKIDVACLFSDIRGYTQGSKDLEAFIGESVMPEVKMCSDAVEKYKGIPRKIGDLIFAYFDSSNIESNVLGAVVSGMEIAQLNHDMNATSSTIEIKRYVLISCGEALVGNLGGLDSSIEITALGSPVNFLSRVDELTKHPKMSQWIQPGDLILCERSSRLISQLVPEIAQTRLDLQGLAIRDFPEVRSLYSIKATDPNYTAVKSAHKYSRDHKYGIIGKGRLFAA
jgi:class 3 adenylate cyclase